MIDMDPVFYQPRRGVICLAHIMSSFQDLGKGCIKARTISSVSTRPSGQSTRRLRDFIFLSYPNACSETRRGISNRSRGRGQSWSDRAGESQQIAARRSPLGR